MYRADVQNGIKRSWDAVDLLGLGETFGNGRPLPVNEEFRNLILRDDSSYVSVYMFALRLSHYNFLLRDFSFFQFGWDAEDHVRYAYYPNPFVAGREDGGISDIKRWHDLVETEFITYEEYLSIIRDAKAEVRIPLIRYENAPNQYREIVHPCSHFHIGFHGDNRWPISRVLTPLAFTLLILKNYYGETWRSLGGDELDESGNKLETQLAREKMNCRIVGESRFSLIEAKSFYFT